MSVASYGVAAEHLAFAIDHLQQAYDALPFGSPVPHGDVERLIAATRRREGVLLEASETANHQESLLGR